MTPEVDLRAETKWVKSLNAHREDYNQSLSQAVNGYVDRVISALRISQELGRRTSENWSASIDSDSISEIVKSIASAYMSGKARANNTLPISKVPSVGFRMGDMDTINRLRDFNQDEVRKLVSDFKVMVKLRTLENRDLGSAIESIREDHRHTQGRVDRLSATEIMRSANAGRIEEYLYHRVAEVRWIAIGNVCDRCRELDGKLFFMSQLPPLPRHPFCLCTIIATR